MNIIPQLLREILDKPEQTQRELAIKLNISLGSTNKYIHDLEEKHYLIVQDDGYQLTEEGQNYLSNYRVDNALDHVLCR